MSVGGADAWFHWEALSVQQAPSELELGLVLGAVDP